MAERTSYAPGTPSWVDLASPDTAAAAEFYDGLFGWKAEMVPTEEAGGYGMFTLHGKLVAGLGPLMDPAMPPAWSVYVSVTDAGATAAKASAAGGQVVVAPMDIFESGRMAVLQDPLATFVSIWQPKEHIGAQLVNEPGTFVWNELATTDLARSKAFYTTVFGWGLSEDTEEAAAFTVDGNVVCGAHPAREGEFPAWSVWFAVADCDAAAARATELGGALLMPPNDMDFGRAALVADPHGAVFGING